MTGVIAGTIVGGVLGLFVVGGICFGLIIAISYWCSGPWTLPNKLFVASRMRKQIDSTFGIFHSGVYTITGNNKGSLIGTKSIRLTFSGADGRTVDGHGRDTYGSFIITGVFSPKTLSMAFDKTYRSDTENYLVANRQERVQVQWNQDTHRFEGKSHSIHGGRRQVNSCMISRSSMMA